MQAAAAALDALLPLDGELSNLAALQEALATLQAAGSTDSYVPNAVADLAAVRAVALDVGDIAATLRALQSDYSAAEPCMVALLERAAAINATCLTLPAALQADVALLGSARDALSALMKSPGSSPVALADTLDASLPLAIVDAALAQLATAVSLRETIASADLPTAMGDLQAVAASLNASAGQLETASDGMSTYLATFPTGGAPPAAWAAASALVRAAGLEVGAAAAQAPANTSVLDQAPTLLALLPDLHAALVGQEGVIAGMAGQLDSVPDVAPHLATLGELSSVYSGLPQPPSRLAEQAQAELAAIVQGAEEASAAAGWVGRERACKADGCAAGSSWHACHMHTCLPSSSFP